MGRNCFVFLFFFLANNTRITVNSGHFTTCLITTGLEMFLRIQLYLFPLCNYWPAEKKFLKNCLTSAVTANISYNQLFLSEGLDEQIFSALHCDFTSTYCV